MVEKAEEEGIAEGNEESVFGEIDGMGKDLGKALGKFWRGGKRGSIIVRQRK